ncbi:lysophospholipid acyltransferase 5-like [Carlito syrichta]|uniref:Lysophospholipid acyltransferase 5 n=1 Tax=Carlito syrichta TaxID=1868482 RepID=A0A3Q0ECS2_CARSF|nr:lysophospholipid acyltransferase 5-like [Carlito syrichta]
MAAERDAGAAGPLWPDVPELSLGELAASLGASEQALRLVISIFLGYPLALFYRHYHFYKDSCPIHLFHTFTGLSIACFNVGNQLCHALLCVVLLFLILQLLGRTVTAVLLTFGLQTAYLLAGYYTATGNDNIKWTMPHCVLTLKLMGLATDYLDGGKDQHRPCPQAPEPGPGPRLPGGLHAAQPTHHGRLPPHRGLRKPPFWFRCMYMLVWGKFVLYQCVTCWLVTEGVCILTGLGFNDFTEAGKAKWEACANTKVALRDNSALHWHHRLVQHQHQRLGGPLLLQTTQVPWKQRALPGPLTPVPGPLAWPALGIPGLLPDGIPHRHRGETGRQADSGELHPEQPGLHDCPATCLLLGATDHPLALHGLLGDCLLPLHVGQMTEGVQIHLFSWPHLLLESTIHTALCSQSNGAKERESKEDGIICLLGGLQQDWCRNMSPSHSAALPLSTENRKARALEEVLPSMPLLPAKSSSGAKGNTLVGGQRGCVSPRSSPLYVALSLPL